MLYLATSLALGDAFEEGVVFVLAEGELSLEGGGPEEEQIVEWHEETVDALVRIDDCGPPCALPC